VARGPRSLVTRPENVFVNLLLLVTTSAILLTSPKDVKKKIVILISSASSCISVRIKFKIICNYTINCTYYNKMYIGNIGFLAFGSNGRTVLGPREEESSITLA
jgi:hypothetical protein